MSAEQPNLLLLADLESKDASPTETASCPGTRASPETPASHTDSLDDTTLDFSHLTLNPSRESSPDSLSDSTSSSSSSRARILPADPEQVLASPNMIDDFYTQLISWSCGNIIAASNAKGIDLHTAESLHSQCTTICPRKKRQALSICSLEFSRDGKVLGVGYNSGTIELWDIETQYKVRTILGSSDGGFPMGVICLSWNKHVLSSGWEAGQIRHYDVRCAQHCMGQIVGHMYAVCGLKWRDDGVVLASGCNEGTVKIWDGRVDKGSVGLDQNPITISYQYAAAVKALAWCPQKPSLLASGGGARDPKIHVWETSTGESLYEWESPSQVTSVHWSPDDYQEFLTTHGDSINGIIVHSYKDLERVIEIPYAHSDRVLWSALGPKGDTLCTGAPDGLMKLWKIWES